MTVLFIDGFDKYGAPGAGNVPALLVAEWTESSNNVGISGPLSSTGYSVTLGNGSITKTLPGDFTRIIGGVRFKSNLGGSQSGDGGGVALVDGNFTQAYIRIDSGTGTISLVGFAGNTGTTIAKTTVVSIKANSIHYLEWDITTGPAGAYFVYLDGIVILSGNGNTSGGTGNSKCNQFALTSGNSTLTYDDLYIFDITGPTNNAVLLTNPRIETQFPIADDAITFTNNQTIVGTIIPSGGDSGGDFIFQNTMFLAKVIPEANMTLNTLVYGTSSSPIDQWTAVVYSDLAGAPHTLLAQSLDTQGYTGQPFTLPLITPLALTEGTTYWVGAMWKTDILVNTSQRIGASVTDNLLSGRTLSRTYSLGPPGTAPTMAIAQPTYLVYGICTLADQNWETVNRNPPPGDLSFISSSTPGNEDLYRFPNLTTHPTAIYTVAVKGFVKLTDTGNRSADLRMRSVATSSSGSFAGQIPSISYEWIESFFDVDPNTSTAWTESALNSAVSGIKVAT